MTAAMKPSAFTTTLLAAAIASAMPAAAQEKKQASARTTAYQTSVSQEQLRSTSRRLKGEMVALLNEFCQYKAASGELKKL